MGIPFRRGIPSYHTLQLQCVLFANQDGQGLPPKRVKMVFADQGIIQEEGQLTLIVSYGVIENPTYLKAVVVFLYIHSIMAVPVYFES